MGRTSLYDRIASQVGDGGAPKKMTRFTLARVSNYSHLLSSSNDLGHGHKKNGRGQLVRASVKRVENVTNHENEPGDCENCKAGAKWARMGPGIWCFHASYYLCKQEKPISCDIARKNCPLK
jgi:hypothetical protein